MSRVTLDEASIEKLRSSAAPVQILDAEGKVIGTFTPAMRVYKRGEVPDISEEELQRRYNESPRMTTEEVLRRLGGAR
jgi:hypothetical protein